MVTFTNHPGFNNKTFVKPEGFPFPINHGLHPDAHGLVFFETGEHQFFYEGVKVDDYSVTFTYSTTDSDDGQVFISFVLIHGSTRDVPDSEAQFADVQITTGSDVWGLEDTADAVREAVSLHRALSDAGLLPYKFMR